MMTSFGLYDKTNFPGFKGPVDFLIQSFAKHFFALKVPTKLNVVVNLESLIGQRIEQKQTADAFVLQSIEQQDELFIYTVNVSQGTKVFLQIKFWIETDSGKLTNKIKYKAYLVDPKLWPLKSIHFPVALANSDWKITVQREEEKPKSS